MKGEQSWGKLIDSEPKAGSEEASSKSKEPVEEKQFASEKTEPKESKEDKGQESEQ